MLNLTENLPRKRKRFNPYALLATMADHPLVTSYIIGWALAIVLFVVGAVVQDDGMVGVGLLLGYVLLVGGVFTGLYAFACWSIEGGWDRLRRNLRDKMDNYDRIED